MLWCPTELLRSAQCLVSSQPFSIVTRNAEIWGGYSKLCLTPSQVWFYCSSYGLTPVLPDCLTAVNKIFDAATALDNNREMWRELSEWLCIVLTLGHATQHQPCQDPCHLSPVTDQRCARWQCWLVCRNVPSAIVITPLQPLHSLLHPPGTPIRVALFPSHKNLAKTQLLPCCFSINYK